MAGPLSPAITPLLIWHATHGLLGMSGKRWDLGEYPNVQRWYEQIAARPATQTAYAKGEAVRNA
jgi:hypothetical protein